MTLALMIIQINNQIQFVSSRHNEPLIVVQVDSVITVAVHVLTVIIGKKMADVCAEPPRHAVFDNVKQ